MKKIWSYLSIPAAALAVLTGSIAWVVLLRPFYYVQIGPLGVCQASGLTAAQARAWAAVRPLAWHTPKGPICT